MSRHCLPPPTRARPLPTTQSDPVTIGRAAHLKLEVCVCANFKGLEDEAEELEELSKLAVSPARAYSSVQVSPNPADCSEYAMLTAERAEEALSLIPDATTAAADAPDATEEQHAQQPPPPQHQHAASDPPTPAKGNGGGRRTSHSWRGLKKQLSRVDLKLKNTFNASSSAATVAAAATAVNKKTVAATFYGGEQAGGGGGDGAENDETPVPQIVTEITDGGHQEHRPPTTDYGPVGHADSTGTAAARPTELRLFDRDGKPIKPPRTAAKDQQHRKRTSLDKQPAAGAGLQAAAASRDARLLSVPNIKYNHRDPRHNRSNNQAFIGLIKRLSK